MILDLLSLSLFFQKSFFVFFNQIFPIFIKEFIHKQLKSYKSIIIVILIMFKIKNCSDMYNYM